MRGTAIAEGDLLGLSIREYIENGAQRACRAEISNS